MPQNIESLLQFADHDDDYLDGLDLVVAGAPLEDFDETALIDDEDFAVFDDA